MHTMACSACRDGYCRTMARIVAQQRGPMTSWRLMGGCFLVKQEKRQLWPGHLLTTVIVSSANRAASPVR